MKLQDYFETDRKVMEFVQVGDEYTMEFQAKNNEYITVKLVGGGREHLPGFYVSDKEREARFCYNPSLKQDERDSGFHFLVNSLAFKKGWQLLLPS